MIDWIWKRLCSCGALIGSGWDAEVCMEETGGGYCEEHKPQWMRDHEEETGEPW